MDRTICDDLARALRRASRDERNEIIREYMNLYKISRTTAYRWARAGGYDSGRAGVGGKKAKPQPTDKLQKVAALIHQTATRKYAPTLTTKRAIRVAEQNGICEKGELTRHQVDRYLREHCPRGAHKMETVHVARRPDHVNQFGQFDVSVCAQFYLKPDGAVDTQDPAIYWTKNKRGKGPAILRAVYTEVATGAWYPEYFTGSESTENLLPILWRAMMPKEREEQYPLKGMPDILLCDKGSGLDNGYCANLFENVGIEFRTHAKGNPRAKGSVETAMFNIVERQIESLLRFEPATTVEDLNRKIRPLVIELNGCEDHGRYRMSRSMAFASWVKREHLRLPPSSLDHFKSLAYREIDRKIGSNLSFTFRGERYSFQGDRDLLRDPRVVALAGQRVTVMYSPFDRDKVRVVAPDGTLYEAPKERTDAMGYPTYAVRMKAPGSAPEIAKTFHQQNIEALRNVELPEKITAFHNEDILKNLSFMTKPAKDFEPRDGDPTATPVRIARLDAKARLQQRLGRKLTVDESARLNRVWGEMVSEEEIERELQRLQPQIHSANSGQVHTDEHGLERRAEAASA